jgi:hypothetical protein
MGVARSADAIRKFANGFFPLTIWPSRSRPVSRPRDGGVLRTIGDVRTYMLALSEDRELLDHWKAAYRLLVWGASAAELTQQVHLALSLDGELNAEARFSQKMTADQTL